MHCYFLVALADCLEKEEEALVCYYMALLAVVKHCLHLLLVKNAVLI